MTLVKLVNSYNFQEGKDFTNYLAVCTKGAITGSEETIYTLFYEFYRGYTIYSIEDGQCCIHARDGCLQIEGKYACFLDIEQAKTLIKHFRADGPTPQESMNRYVPEHEYLCLQPRWRQPVVIASTNR
jgi:hypothetical protein